MAAGLRSAMAASRARAAGNAALLPRSEQDIPIGYVALISLACMVPIGALIANFAAGSGLGGHMLAMVAGALVYIALMSFFVSAVCGYMAGLIGSSNSPLSGIGILVVIGAALLLVPGIRSGLPAGGDTALVAYALFVTAVVFAVATIANNNLQDLKTGQLVDATPWKQQVALVIGVIAGAVIIPPILDLLNHAYGFAGAPGPHHEHPLPAPQAGLISALAQGVIQHNVDWSLIRIGALVGVLVIAADETAAAIHPLGAPLAARRGPGDLPADAKHADGRGRRDRGLVLRPPRAARVKSRGHQAARRAAGFGHDRRRRPGGRAHRRLRRLLGQGLSAGPGRR